MSLFSLTKNSKYKTYSFLGIKVTLPRKEYKKTLRLYKKLPKNPLLKTDGYSLVGNFSRIYGESQVAKDFMKALDKFKISYDKSELSVAANPPQYKEKITFTTAPYATDKRYINSSVLFWEFESGMMEARPYLFDGLQRVIVFSDFNYRYFNTLVPPKIKLVKLSYPFDFDAKPTISADEMRSRYGLKQTDFVALFCFSYASSYFRKNPEAVLEAFALALAEKDNAKLILKNQVHIKNDYEQRLLAKIRQLHLEQKVLLLNEDLSRTEILSLINCCDVYLSLHRGEGLGLSMLEAMSLKKPVIATNYGGNTEFVKDGIAFPINYKLVEPQEIDMKDYQSVRYWAEPDINQAAECLRYCYENPEKAEKIGNKGFEFVAKQFSAEWFLASLREGLI